MTDATDNEDVVAHGRTVIAIEAEAVGALGARIDANFAAACTMILECAGRVVVIGMGKSGHVGGKIASTLASDRHAGVLRASR